MAFIDAPAKPAVSGTFPLGPAEFQATYTAGPPAVAEYELVRWFNHGQMDLAVDIETFGLGKDALRLKSVALATDRAAVVLDPRDPAGAEIIRWAIGRARTLVFHNSPFDVPNMHRAGLIGLDDIGKIRDTLVYARLAFPDLMQKKGLENLAKRFLGLDSEETIKLAFRRLGITITEGYRKLDISSPMYLMGNATDAVVTARVLPRVRAAALATLTTGHPFTVYGVQGAEAERLVEREQQINRLWLRRSCRGLRVDLEFLDRYRAENDAAKNQAELQLGTVEIRPGNGNDLIKYLEGAGALPEDWPRTKTGRASTTADHLDRLDDEVSRLFVQHKQVTKIENDYLSKVADLADEHDRVHPEFNILKATTGRASIGNPPFHQFPAPARGIILADEGDALTSIDWSQVEPVIAANVAGDLDALAGYEAGTTDFYQGLADRAGIGRKPAKIVLLAQLYGEGMRKLAADLNLRLDDGSPDIDAAKELREFIFRALPKTGRLLWKLRTIAEEHRQVFTLSGRILSIPMGRGFDGGPPSVATHKGVNYFVQGSAYDGLAEATVAIDDAGLGDALYLQMHDELVCSTDAAHDVQRLMEVPPERLVMLAKRVPVLRTDRADLGERWAKPE